MGSLDTRLKRLEDDGKPCPECGDLDWAAEEEDEERPECYPEWCPECGRQLVYVVRWLDLEDSK